MSRLSREEIGKEIKASSPYVTFLSATRDYGILSVNGILKRIPLQNIEAKLFQPAQR